MIALILRLIRNGLHENRNRRSLDILREILHQALNAESQLDATIVLDHVDRLDDRDLTTIRNVLQDLLDSQRYATVAQTRALVFGDNTYHQSMRALGYATRHEAGSEPSSGIGL